MLHKIRLVLSLPVSVTADFGGNTSLDTEKSWRDVLIVVEGVSDARAVRRALAAEARHSTCLSKTATHFATSCASA